MTASKEEIGVMMNYELDLAFGEDENDFECRIASNAHCCEPDYYLYIEGTEYGGIIDDIEVNTNNNEVIYGGRTWHGILESKVIVPLKSNETSTSNVTVQTKDASGASLVDRYLVVTGDANACIGFVLNRIGVSDLFVASESTAGVNIKSFQFDRYTDAYAGLVKMLDSVKMRMQLEYQGNKVVVSAVKQYDYATDEEFDTDLVELRMKKRFNTVNHLICLGKGELENRMIVHLYTDESGNISQTQTQFGMNERMEIYDYSAVESEEELVSQGIERLKTLWESDELTINLDDTSDFYNVGDKVGATDNITKLTVSAKIKKKIVKINNGQITISYEVGE